VLAGQTRGAIGLSLNFLFLFVSRQKESKGRNRKHVSDPSLSAQEDNELLIIAEKFLIKCSIELQAIQKCAL
jgi:hypothetical protein